MSTQHTPGPWKVNFTTLCGIAARYHVAGPVHGSVFPICEKVFELGEDRSVSMADAALIAAAPETAAERDRLRVVNEGLIVALDNCVMALRYCQVQLPVGDPLLRKVIVTEREANAALAAARSQS